MRLIRFASCCLPVGLALSATTASAEPGATRSIALSAHVASFCRVSHANDVAIISRGAADLGPVTEICNAGYRLVANFSNLRSATVRTGEGDVEMGSDGMVALTRPEARKIVQDWALRGAVKQVASAPVTVRFTVSPL